MTMTKHFIEADNLSDAWGEALQIASAKGESEIVPLIVSVTGFQRGVVRERSTIRAGLEAVLKKRRLASCETVAGTIFPEALWNAARPRSLLFQRYRRLFQKLRQSNPLGHYFDRMTTGGPARNENQLDFVLNAYSARRSMRRSALQVAIFDPRRDHSTAALRGFPCLQHVTFAPDGDGLAVNAFYAMQYLVERAYGNYLGLCRLGRFVAHELGRPLTRMTCYSGIAKLDVPKSALTSVLKAVANCQTDGAR